MSTRHNLLSSTGVVFLCLAGTILGLSATNTAWAQVSDPDLNDDGCVTGQDVKIVATCRGKNGTAKPNCQIDLADTDADGDVDRDDLRFVVDSNGVCGFPVGGNNAPIADAGSNQSALIADTVHLDGSGSSDTDGDPLTFSWSLVPPVGSVAVLSDASAVNPSFVVDVAGSYAIQLVVNDGTEDSFPDSINVSTINSPPVADAGPDQTVFVLETVHLDGIGSSDTDGDPLAFSWSLNVPAGSVAVLSDPTAVNPSFDVDLPGTYVVLLTVNDGMEDSVPDSVIITTTNSRPVADAGPDQTVFVGDTVTLDGSASADVDGDLLTFSWSLTTIPAGSAVTLPDPTAVTPTIVIDQPGTYVAQLIVNDGAVDSGPVSVTVTGLGTMIDINDVSGANGRLGAGLQADYRVTLQAPAPAGGVTVRVTSSMPGSARVAPDATTIGTAFVDLFIAEGGTTVDFVTQGVTGTAGTATLTGSDAGGQFASSTFDVQVVQPSLDIADLATTTSAGAADDEFRVFTATPSGSGSGISAFHPVSALAGTLSVTINSSNGFTGELFTTAGGQAATVSVQIPVAANGSPVNVAGGGSAFRALAAGATTVSADAAGFDAAFATASELVTVNP